MALERVFADEPAFVPYVAAGDPSDEASIEYVEALERGGADVIELGLPFSEPIAEGSTIQGAVTRALEAGMTPSSWESRWNASSALSSSTFTASTRPSSTRCANSGPTPA